MLYHKCVSSLEGAVSFNIIDKMYNHSLHYVVSFFLTLLLLFSVSVMTNSLWSHVWQHSRFLCPSPSPGVCLNSCPLIQWCHPTISSSIILFSSCLRSFPASRAFPMSQLSASGGQSQWSRSRCFCNSLAFFYNPMNVGILISGSFAFSKFSLYV